jgi:tetratricopeptide (TPR) repeat protein
MKRIVILAFTSLFVVAAFGANNLLKKANELYAQKDYNGAIQQYEMVKQIQGESAELYYNLGNAYYRTGDMAHAILNYNRALLLKPDYDDAQFNLKIVQRKIVDNVDVTSAFFLVEWFDDFGDLLSSDGWAVLSVIFFIIVLASILFYIFARYKLIRQISLSTGVLAIVIAFLSIVYSFKQSNKVDNCTDGIIMTGSVTSKDSPTLTGKDMFVLHTGTKVTIKNTISGWVEIELPDGNSGFIPANDIEKI